MKIGFNVALMCAVTTMCITAIVIVALSLGHNSGVITGSIASLISLPTGIVTFLATKKHYSKDVK